MCRLSMVNSVIDTSSLARLRSATTEVSRDEVARITLDLKNHAAFDWFNDIPETGRFVIVDGFDVAGGGIIPRADLADSYQI